MIDVRHQVVLVHREPTPTGYRLVTAIRRGERLSPLAFPDRLREGRQAAERGEVVTLEELDCELAQLD